MHQRQQQLAAGSRRRRRRFCVGRIRDGGREERGRRRLRNVRRAVASKYERWVRTSCAYRTRRRVIFFRYHRRVSRYQYAYPDLRPFTRLVDMTGNRNSLVFLASRPLRHGRARTPRSVLWYFVASHASNPLGVITRAAITEPRYHAEGRPNVRPPPPASAAVVVRHSFEHAQITTTTTTTTRRDAGVVSRNSRVYTCRLRRRRDLMWSTLICFFFLRFRRFFFRRFIFFLFFVFSASVRPSAVSLPFRSRGPAVRLSHARLALATASPPAVRAADDTTSPHRRP